MNNPIKILLVEDNPIDALIINKVFNKSSYGNSTLLIARSMADAIKFSKENILLLLLDLKLPDSEGLNSIKHICKYFPDSALIVLTHLEDEEVAIEALKEGAQNYLNKKDLNINVLDRAIRYSLERNRIIQKLRATEKELVQSNIFLEKAQEVAHMGSWMANLINGTIVLSDEAQLIFGFIPGEFDKKQATFFSMIHPDDVELLNKKIHESVAKKIIFKLVHRITRKDGVERWVNSAAEIVFDDKGIPRNMIGSIQDITETKTIEKKINKTNRLYAFISQVNQNIVRIKDEESLFRNACSIAIEFGKFKMAWIGMFDIGEKKITLNAHNGIPDKEVKLFINTTYQANGLQDYVLRTGTYHVCNDVEHTPELESWIPFAKANGISSCIVLPIKKSGSIIGTFNLYSTELNFFDTEEIKLLVEVTGDISFAIELFEKDKQHKKIEQEVIVSEERFHSLFDNMLEAFAYCKMVYRNGIPEDFIYIDVNDAFEKLTGLKNVKGKKVTELIPHIKEDSPELFEVYGRVALSGKPERFESYLESIQKWFNISVYSNEKEHFVAVFDSITERKNMEHQQEFDKNNLDALINNTKDLMWSVDKDFNLITFNQPFDDIIKLMSGKGLTKGNNILSVSFSPSQLTRYAQFYERAFEGEAFTEIEYNDSPVEFWSEISFYPIRKGNEIVGTACHSHDITERRRSEEDLKQSESRFREIFDSAPQGIVVVDITTLMFVKYNDNAIKILKYSGEEILKKGPVDVSPQFQPDGRLSQEKAIELIMNAINGEKIVFEWVVMDANGLEIMCEIRLVVLSNIGGPQVLINFIDITERKKAETEREKMTSDIVQRNKDLEQFSYIVSHNLRAPVANIIGLSEAAQFEDLAPVQYKEIMRGLSHSVNKLDEVIIDLNNILKVKHDVSEKKELVHFSRLASDVHSSIENIIEKEKATLIWDFSEVDEINTVKSYLHSIFFNLISNSLKYRRPGVPLIIEIRSHKVKNNVQLNFIDNGMGIDLEKRGDQLFGLYKRFHTKVAEGKGMGLYMVKAQVEALGGKISIESEVNKGSTFKIEFENL